MPRRGQRGRHAGDDADRRADQQGPQTAHPVRQRTKDQLPRAGAEQEGGQGELDTRGIGAQFLRHGRARGQVQIRGEGGQAGQEREYQQQPAAHLPIWYCR